MPFTDAENKRIDELLKGVPGGGGGTNSESTPGSIGSAPGDTLRGVAQAGLNVVEGPAQWAEQGIRHIPGLSEFKMPLHDWAAGFRKRAESTPAGIAGEVGGTIAPFLIPGLDVAAALRGGAAASTLARLAAAAQRLPGAARAVGAASRVGEVAGRLPGAERAREAWQGASSGQRAFVKAGTAGTLLTPKDSEHFGREALEDFLVGGALGRLGNIGERVGRSGRTIEDLYREGEIPMIFKKTPMGGYQPPKTRPPTERTEAARTESALKEARRLRGELEGGLPEAAKPGFVRFYHGGADPQSGGGRWVSPHYQYARDYRPGQPVHYVDIPQKWLDQRFPDTQLYKGPYKQPYPSFEVPEALAKRMRPFEARAPLQNMRSTFERNYPAELKAGAEQYGRDARQQWERAQSAYQRRRNLPHHLGHLGWHLPFLFGHQLGLPMAARYFGASMLSWLARQWGRELARRGATGQRLPPHRDYTRLLGNISPYGLGLAGANVTQQTGADELVGPMLEPDTE